MSTIAFPDFLEDPSSFSLEQDTNQRGFESPGGGSDQEVDMLNDRWNASVSISPRSADEAAAVEAFVASLRKRTNIVYLYHLQRPQPRGTYSGDLSIFLPTGPGADAVYLKGGGASQFLLAGDMIGVNGMLLQVASDCVADSLGRIGVPIVNRLRRATAENQAVTWDRPTVPFRLVSRSAVLYVPGYAPEVSFDFVEAIL